MRNTFFLMFFISLLTVTLVGCDNTSNATNNHRQRASQTLDSIYAHYSVAETALLRENYPFDEDYLATYLASEEQSELPNPFAYLWPYSGTFSAVNALMEVDMDYREVLDSKVLVGLEEYLDTLRKPAGYASYIQSAPQSDRFYDDNVWLGIDFTDVYQLTGDEKYLEKAELIWKFIESGMDSLLGGGVYWCEQKRNSKNTCSNAPGAVYALKLYKATNKKEYLDQGEFLYTWAKQNLQDQEDFLYYDNIKLNGKVDKTKYAYNSGQMLQAAALLHNITDDPKYLDDAQEIARACYGYFFHEFTSNNGAFFRLLNKGNIWFTAVMFRGFVELYHIDGNNTYIKSFEQSLDYAWEHSRDSKGLFSRDWSGKEQDKTKWLLTQAAMTEMYARLDNVMTKTK